MYYQRRSRVAVSRVGVPDLSPTTWVLWCVVRAGGGALLGPVGVAVRLPLGIVIRGNKRRARIGMANAPQWAMAQRTWHQCT